VTDGREVVALPPARDHKRVGDGDTGPNTGGMGAFSPVPDVPDSMADDLVMRMHRPILRELARRGVEYRGALYAGLMLTADGPYLLECNVRFGDPETQVLLPRLDGPFAALLLAAASGELGGMSTDVTASVAVGVVVAAAGYPDSPGLGDPIKADDLPDEQTIRFWSGVQATGDGRLATAGGRVATIVGLGPDLEAAADAAYGSLDTVRFEGRHFRRDIGRTTVMAGAAT
jgi:phosphoribosylamine--glycine ligase